MKHKNKEKINTILYCEQVLKNAELEAEKESISLIDKFNSMRKNKMRLIQKMLDTKDIDDIDFDSFEDELILAINELEDELMGVEMKLQESLGASTAEFFDRVRRIIEEMKNKLQTL